MIKNPAFYFNSELCTGCKACMIACIDKHNLNKGVLWRRVLEYSGGEWLPVGDAYEQNVFAYYVSLSSIVTGLTPVMKQRLMLE